MKGRRFPLLGLSAVWMAAAPGLVLAQSLYQHKVSVDMGLERDSNPTLSTTGRGVSRLRMTPHYTLLRSDGADDLSLNLGATLERSSDTTLSQNRKDADVRVQWQHAAESTTYTTNAGYQQSALRDALLQETGQQVGVDGTRTVRNLGFSVMHMLDPLYRVSGGLQAQWSSFTGNTMPDSRQLSASAELSRALAPGQEMFVGGELSSYAPDRLPGQLSQNSVMRSAVIGYRSQIAGSPWDWSVSGGAASYTGPFSDTTAKGEIRIGYTGERWNTSASWSRQPVTDTLRGSFSQNQQMRLTAEYAWSELTRIALEASHNRTQSTQQDTSKVLGLRVSHDLSPLWSMGLHLSRTQVRRAGASSIGAPQASGHSVGVVLTYTHPDF